MTPTCRALHDLGNISLKNDITVPKPLCRLSIMNFLCVSCAQMKPYPCPNEAFDDFCTQRGLVVNLGKTKVLVLQAYARGRTTCHLILSHRPVEVVGLYVYLGVTFNARSGKFSMTLAAKDRLTRGYVSFSLLESLGSRATTFHVYAIRETIGDDAITSTPKQIDNTT